MAKQLKSSDYIQHEFREYSLHVINERALPNITDGLKPSGRRCLWKARDGKKRKVSTLAGETLSIHPHSLPTSPIESLTFPYSNNIPLFEGHGTFGTLLNPKSAAAPRYTAVSVSDFTKDVIFVDLDIIPLTENHDKTELEPIHFLPLVPIVLINSQDGIAVSIATSILPRNLKEIIDDQIKVLKNPNTKLPEREPYIKSTNQYGELVAPRRYLFKGTYKINGNVVNVTELPYGVTYKDFKSLIADLVDKGVIQKVVDKSKDKCNVTITFADKKVSEQAIIKTLKLHNTVLENLNVIDFDQQHVIPQTYSGIVRAFCKWRAPFFKQRYQRLAKILEKDVRRYQDILTVIKKNLLRKFQTEQSKTSLKRMLKNNGVHDVDYISELGGYRFTKYERNKVEQQLKQTLKQLKTYRDIIDNEQLQRQEFIKELQNIKRKYC